MVCELSKWSRNQPLFVELTLIGKGVVLKTTSKDASPVGVQVLYSTPCRSSTTVSTYACHAYDDGSIPFCGSN